MTKITYIPSEIANAAVDEQGNRKPVTRTHYIFDDEKGKNQSVINQEVDETIGDDETPDSIKGRIKELENQVGEGGTVDERIANAKSEVIGGASSDYNTLKKAEDKIKEEAQRAEDVEDVLNARLQTVEELAEISVGGGDIGIATAADFESDDPSDLAKVPTIGAMLSGVNDGIYDISARHSGTKYADLATALGTNGDNVPSAVRKGGMSIKFVQSSDNKYVQCRLMADEFSTDPADWQGVDDEPTSGSQNMVKSGGVQRFTKANIEAATDNISHSALPNSNTDDEVVFEDNDGNEVAVIDKNGLSAAKANIINLSADNISRHGVSLVDEQELELEVTAAVDNIEHKVLPDSNTDDEVVFEDNDGNEVATIGKNGVETKGLSVNNMPFLFQKSDISDIARNIPIVVFIYDDSNINDLDFIDKFDARGLKITLAPLGSTTFEETSWVKKVKVAVSHGHGTIGHGKPSGVSVSGDGINQMTDHDALLCMNTNKKWLEHFGFSSKGLAYFNTMTINKHTMALIQACYDYAFSFGAAGYTISENTGVNTPEQSLLALSRYPTDNASMLEVAKEKIIKHLGQNCILAFGGHSARTGQGGSYSTMNDFVALLDFIQGLANAGLVYSLNADDAVASMMARANNDGVIKTEYAKAYGFTGELNFCPLLYRTIYKEGNVKVCTNAGKKAIHKISIAGTVVNGSTDVTLDGEDSFSIVTTSEMSVSDVANLFLSRIYKANTVRYIDGILYVIHDAAEVITAPSVSNNTTGLTFTVTEVVGGAAPIYSNI